MYRQASASLLSDRLVFFHSPNPNHKSKLALFPTQMIFLKRRFGPLSALVLYLKANIVNTVFFDHEYSLFPIEIVVISNYV